MKFVDVDAGAVATVAAAAVLFASANSESSVAQVQSLCR